MLRLVPNAGLTPYDHVRLVAIDGHAPYAPDPSLGGLNPGEKVLAVGATLDVEGGDGSTPNGNTPMGFELVRSGPDHAWRVFETGLG
jgi:hypothetical protein